MNINREELNYLTQFSYKKVETLIGKRILEI